MSGKRRAAGPAVTKKQTAPTKGNGKGSSSGRSRWKKVGIAVLVLGLLGSLLGVAGPIALLALPSDPTLLSIAMLAGWLPLGIAPLYCATVPTESARMLSRRLRTSMNEVRTASANSSGGSTP